jgi:hypothetical protein
MVLCGSGVVLHGRWTIDKFVDGDSALCLEFLQSVYLFLESLQVELNFLVDDLQHPGVLYFDP